MAGAHKLNFEFGHQKRSIESMEANSNFNMQELADDISIITVSEPFDFSDPHVQPIDTFKTGDAAIPDGTTCVSTGKIYRTSLNLFELKVAFIQKVRFVFLNLPQTYSKLLSWAWNLNLLFTVIGGKFKFHVQDT